MTSWDLLIRDRDNVKISMVFVRVKKTTYVWVSVHWKVNEEQVNLVPLIFFSK